VQVHFRQAGNGTQQDILDTGLCSRCNGDGISIAAQTCGDPQNVDIGDGLWPLGFSAVRNCLGCHAKSPFAFWRIPSSSNPLKQVPKCSLLSEPTAAKEPVQGAAVPFGTGSIEDFDLKNYSGEEILQSGISGFCHKGWSYKRIRESPMCIYFENWTSTRHLSSRSTRSHAGPTREHCGARVSP
jgi:hypothetical protein